MEWDLVRIHASKSWHNCHLCNKRIKVCVTLSNSQNGSYLIVGEECHEKLVHLVSHGKVESVSPIHAMKGNLRRYWRKLADRTVVGWLKEELCAGRLTEEVADIVYTITQLGFAPTTDDADMVIAFYKATRRFPLVNLLRCGELFGFRHSRLLPKMITIDQIERIRELLAKDKVIREKLEAIRRKSAEMQLFHERVTNVLARLKDLADKLRVASGNGVEKALASAEAVEKKAVAISRLVQKTNDAFHDVACNVEEMANTTESIHRWNLVNPETVLSVRSERGRYILVKKDGRWHRITQLECYVERWVKSVTGVYKAVVLHGKHSCLVMLVEQLESSEVLLELDFTEPSRTKSGSFVAKHRGKIVLPSRDICRSGPYLVCLLGDEGKYYRAWIV
ncbi:MAG: hypothetical protein Q7S57_01970 [bacterium]|nr:hypothetical protein [bacterium]